MTQNRDILALCILNMTCDNALFVISLPWLNGGRMKVNKITIQCHNISSDVYPWQIPQQQIQTLLTSQGAVSIPCSAFMICTEMFPKDLRELITYHIYLLL